MERVSAPPSGIRHIVVPGRHHLLTRFQADYLRKLLAGEERDEDGDPIAVADDAVVVWAMTSANHAATRRNPFPAHRREAAIEILAHVERMPSIVVPVVDVAPTPRFAEITLKEISHATSERVYPTPATAIVATSTPQVADLYRALRFRIAPMERGHPASPETPWQLLDDLMSGSDAWRTAVHPATLDIVDRYALADQARGRDLYDGIVASGAISTRPEAKIAMLGAMYGATTGESGRLVPALRRAYPRAMGLVDAAARTGEGGGAVTTWLGRSSAPGDAQWREVQDRAGGPDASDADRAHARRSAGDRGRFTRNFIVQGTAAEWALAWLADLRASLAALPPVSDDARAEASGPVFSRRAHLCFFLHDEIIVHAPKEQAEAVAEAVRQSAARAATLLFGGFPIDFPLDLRIGPDAAKS